MFNYIYLNHIEPMLLTIAKTSNRRTKSSNRRTSSNSEVRILIDLDCGLVGESEIDKWKWKASSI